MPDPDDHASLLFDPVEAEPEDHPALQTLMPGRPGAGPRIGLPAGPLSLTGEDTTPAFRPLHRPPMAVLCILHDGIGDGEWVPLRGDRYVIARNEGDIRIPHDGQISGRKHAEIVRTTADGTTAWQLADLGSTNGTFVRVSRVALIPGTEVMFGQTRYRFDANPPPTARPGAGRPSFVEVTPMGDGTRVALLRDEYWLGRDPLECGIVPRDDAFVSPRHARVYRTDSGRWLVENHGSRNGVWVRLALPLRVGNSCQFLLGEQRFILKILT